MPAEPTPPAGDPHRVRLPVNIHGWHDIAFLHWRVAPEAIQSRLPPGLAVHTWDGAAWIGVTPFRFCVQPSGRYR